MKILKKLKKNSRAARAETLGPCGIAKLLAMRVTHCIGTVDALHRQMNAAVAGVECVAGFRRACRVTLVPCLASQCVVPNVEICNL